MSYVSNNPNNFRTELGYSIFKAKYALTPEETWLQRAQAIVDDVCGTRKGTTHPLMSKDERSQLVRLIHQFKFLPGGRYIYYAGRSVSFYNNCFSSEANVLTDAGWANVKDSVGKTLNVLSPVDGSYRPAKFHHHGEQTVQEITFAPLRGRSKKRWKVKATRTHRWILSDGSDTYDLRVGDLVPANGFDAGYDAEGFAHGFVFGDGNRHGQLRVCGVKSRYLEELLLANPSVTTPESANGETVLYFPQGKDGKWKALPADGSNQSYIASFIRGWLSADGHKKDNAKEAIMIANIDKEKLDWLERNAPVAGLVVVGDIRSQVRDVKLGDKEYKDHRIYVLNLQEGSSFAGFKVIDIDELGVEDVYCPYEPIDQQIVIDHGMRTGNCFLFKGEEDTREEWGRLCHSASDALMSGGGIGIDYSIFREKGALLGRTGGVASGPLPLATSINEIGRNVQQGGSRRSAIYGSLNWKHGDAKEWLSVKDWQNLMIPGTSVTYADAKKANFDAHAPLDFTNISLNYDNEFIREILLAAGFGDSKNPDIYLPVRDFDTWCSIVDRVKLPETFNKNTEMAMRNGEPGFSFNFFDKEAETARNAPIHPDTWVYTSTGFTQVKDIVGVPVAMWTGKQYAMATFTKTRSNDEIVEVMFTGMRSIKSSKDHDFILANGERVQAQNLEPGMKVMWEPPVRDGGVHQENAYLLAFAYGDGTFSTRYPKAEVALVGAKEAVLPKLVQLDCEVSRDKRGILRVYYKNNDLFRSREKAVFPREVYSWDYKSQLEFLAGLLDADGNDHGGFARLSSVHYEFLNGVARLCDSLGLTAIINKGSNGTYNGTPTWLLTVRGELTKIPVQRLKLKDVSPTIYKVVSVEDAGLSDVYCCDVGVDEHSFQAEMCIISNCTEVVSEDDSDMCNIGSVNLAAHESLDDFKTTVELASKFLICGTIRGELPDEKTRKVREKNRRIGLGLMGMHEWLLQRGHNYSMNEELDDWMTNYASISEKSANEHCDRFYLSRPVAYRAIAPTGTIGTIAGTTTGLEPIFAVAYKRRYIEGSRETGVEKRMFQYYIDSAAQDMIDRYGVDPESVESAIDLAKDPERRIKFQADVQKHIDMSISSTLNLPEWGSEFNNEDRVESMARTIAKYAPFLRGLTSYPDGSRGGQPLVSVPYTEAVSGGVGVAFEENSENACKSGVCGI